ncbi:MAG: helix-turn-helix transcriptional regulator [Acutalibacteraceae bacterium]|nr:helix-turn-helix transcriptional regulator [Acutalibacteraceae bacterium]
MNSVVYNINRIIKERGLKKNVVAEKAGYSANQFSAFLHGRKTIKASDVYSIAKALEVTPNDLFGINTITKAS